MAWLHLGTIRNISVLLVAAVALFVGVASHDSQAPVLRLGGQTINLEIANTPEAQEKGLSGRTGLPNNRGMLFVYANAEPNRCFWMKDMQFAIDIVWLDAQKRVVHLEQNVQPSTYPNHFCNEKPAQYVLELNANQSSGHGIRPGARLDITHI